ncbi:hypothetical protein N7492_010315 [Penicillium capsulatum]|uniref:Uncharacterized protein n=1 Tax=Penicillium capsulatum TaxID=69766 RepID=A0A9W9HNT0_9EURO|nr:hypothetical protein N7492_010315 [Penicillium capsulatum]KAJ6112821.1 hypothetical protein N7512_008145 [Penicillium capsulatum]
MSLRSGPLEFDHFKISFPHEKVIQVTLSRPEKMNSITNVTSRQLQSVWKRFDEDETLWVGVFTGSGKAFCTGADLQEWNVMNKAGVLNDMSAPGIAGLARRSGKKPIIAAVNGICMGGGFELVANCDLVIASNSAVFALSEVKRGIVPVAGSLPRLTRTIGLQRTTDLALTGRYATAKELYEWGLISRLVGSDMDVADAALRVALEMCNNSPDALIVARLGVRMSWELGSTEKAVSILADQWYPKLAKGFNFAEGIRAFVEKRQPKWINSKL